jgi:hypothetical protein
MINYRSNPKKIHQLFSFFSIFFVGIRNGSQRRSFRRNSNSNGFSFHPKSMLKPVSEDCSIPLGAQLPLFLWSRAGYARDVICLPN